MCLCFNNRFRKVKLTQAGWTIFHEEGHPDMIVAVIGNNFYDVFSFISGAMPLDGENIVRPLKIIYPTNRTKKVSLIQFLVILLIVLFSLMHSASRRPRPNWNQSIHITAHLHLQSTIQSASGSVKVWQTLANRS